jgi:hypothetical protein
MLSLRGIVPTPAGVAAAMELDARTARQHDPGSHHFRGWIVTGSTFASGHVLAVRRFPASSLGPAFTAVSHRDPAGHWTFYSDVEPARSCSRFFDAAGSASLEDEIAVTWLGGHTVSISVLRARISWALHFSASPGAQALGVLARALPSSLRRRRRVRTALARLLAAMLGPGELDLDGCTPSGHRFSMDLERFWLLDASVARINGRHLGPVVLARVQPRLGELRLPGSGVMLAGTAHFVESAAAHATAGTGARVHVLPAPDIP